MSNSKKQEFSSELVPCIAQKSKFGHAKPAAAADHYALGSSRLRATRLTDTLHVNILFDKGVRDDPITIFIKNLLPSWRPTYQTAFVVIPLRLIPVEL